MTSLYLCDSSRPDPWASGQDVRELMVTLWYPASSAEGARARYITPTESELLLRSGHITDVPQDMLSRTRTNAVSDATPAGRPHGLPLVVMSPGFTKPRCTLTTLAEDLASHGHVVAAIDHTYENVATTFPDGRVTTCLARETPHRGPAFWQRVMTGRAADVSFVLDELTGPDAPGQATALIDPARIAMVGHSAGGASAIPALLRDPRILAGMNIDGSTSVDMPDSGLARPFFFLGKASNYTPGCGNPSAATWERDWQRMTGWKRWFVVEGAIHPSFTDLALLAGQLGLDTGATLPADRALEITRACVRAFVDLHLLGTPQPVLDDPSAHYPEVSDCFSVRAATS